MSSANSVLFLTVLLSLSCLSAVLGQGSCQARVGNTDPSCDFRCDSGSYLIECGTKKTDKTSCERSGCCWNPYLPPERPKCFRRNGGFAFCDNALERVSCSDEDISKAECEKRRCCYDDSQGDGQPACFFHNTNYNAVCPYNERVQCGDESVTRQDCLKRGCCYAKIPECEMEPTCFYSTKALNKLKKDLNPDNPPHIPPPVSLPKVAARSEVKDEF